MPLFSTCQRTETDFMRRGEGPLPFIDRTAQAWGEPVRRFWSALYDEVPAGPTRERIHQRLWDPSDTVARGAALELLLHGLFKRLGYDVALGEGTVPGLAGERPDLRARRGEDTFYVEATGAEPNADARRRNMAEGELVAALEALHVLGLGVDIREYGLPGDGSAVEVSKQVASWLASAPAAEEGGRFSEVRRREFNARGWSVAVSVTDAPGSRNAHPTLSSPGCLVDHHERLRRSLVGKARKYKAIESPLLVAVNHLEIGLDDHDIMDALFGDRRDWVVQTREGLEVRAAPRRQNGAWFRAGRLCNRSASAILVFHALGFTNLAQVTPILVHHPEARRPITIGNWPFDEWVPYRTTRCFEPRAGVSLGRFFALPDRWPDLAPSPV